MGAMIKNIFRFLSSYGFACVIFVFLLLLTFLGTMEQVDHGLYEVQKKYFESVFLVHWLFDVVPIPLPGVYLLLTLFTINLIAGGIIRIRKSKSTVGNLITHFGMLVMIFAGFVNYTFAQDGHMTLAENEESAEFVSYFLWEVAISQPVDGKVTTEAIIPNEALGYAPEGESATFTKNDLPFDLTISEFHRNVEVVPPAVDPRLKPVDGFAVRPLPLEKEAELNIAGAYALVKDKKSGESHEAILFGASAMPWTVTVEGKPYLIDLRRKRYTLPFAIALDTFHQETHPGTDMASMFMSEVTKIENGVEQPVKITMNEPLRHKGFTLYQASWQPAQPALGIPEKSTLAVVKNPSDRWPLYSCIIITCGLLLHFTLKLSKYLRAENKRLATRKAV
ncbi:MAG: cytochrome c biogenesis protein ResB [Candidatus Hydrogenedentes bacterium]|nr:cytochrome c biogenesis protein ResB [Candidatus Hydrogenedentota bacterium]